MILDYIAYHALPQTLFNTKLADRKRFGSFVFLR
jgi:hypothetical protein